jgi:hypothetical protein
MPLPSAADPGELQRDGRLAGNLVAVVAEGEPEGVVDGVHLRLARVGVGQRGHGGDDERGKHRQRAPDSTDLRSGSLYVGHGPATLPQARQD